MTNSLELKSKTLERMGENTELLRNSSKISRDMVYMMGVQFVVMLICQLTLFQRIIVSHKTTLWK